MLGQDHQPKSHAVAWLRPSCHGTQRQPDDEGIQSSDHETGLMATTAAGIRHEMW